MQPPARRRLSQDSISISASPSSGGTRTPAEAAVQPLRGSRNTLLFRANLNIRMQRPRLQVDSGAISLRAGRSRSTLELEENQQDPHQDCGPGRLRPVKDASARNLAEAKAHAPH